MVIPVLNEGNQLGSVLDSLVAQDLPSEEVEILVVDGGSTDETVEIACKKSATDPRIQVLHNPARWSSSGRNIGIQAATGEIILIVDGHSEISDKGFLRRVVAAFRSSGADSLARPAPLDTSATGWYAHGLARARASILGHHPSSDIYSHDERFVSARSAATAYRSYVFDRIGLFDESFDACEDVELNHRLDQAGMSCFFVPSLAVPYTPRSTPLGTFRQLRRYGRGQVRFNRKHPGNLGPGVLAPAAALIGATLLTAAGIHSRAARWLLMLGTTFYSSALVAVAVPGQGDEYQPGDLLSIPLALISLHGGAAVGVIEETLFGPAAPPGARQ